MLGYQHIHEELGMDKKIAVTWAIVMSVILGFLILYFYFVSTPSETGEAELTAGDTEQEIEQDLDMLEADLGDLDAELDDIEKELNQLELEL